MRRALLIITVGLALGAATATAVAASKPRASDTAASKTATTTQTAPAGAPPLAALRQQFTLTGNSSLQKLPQGAKPAPDTVVARSNLPAILLLTVVLALVAITLAGWIATRVLAVEPGWITGGRRSFSEAGWRASLAWSDFRDWLRPH